MAPLQGGGLLGDIALSCVEQKVQRACVHVCAGEHSKCVCVCLDVRARVCGQGQSSFLSFLLGIQPRGLASRDFPWGLSTSSALVHKLKGTLGGVPGSSHLASSHRLMSLQGQSILGHTALQSDVPLWALRVGWSLQGSFKS